MTARVYPVGLSPARVKVLRYACRFEAMPDPQDVAEYMGWQSTRGVAEVYRMLRGAGLMQRLKGRGNWAITDAGRAVAASTWPD